MSTLHLNQIDTDTNLKPLHIPRRLLTFCENNEQAILLSQIIYWYDKGNNHQGWFFKSAKEWFDEINIAPRTLRRYTRLFEKAGFLKTIVAKEYGKKYVHYKLDYNLLVKMLRGADNLAEYNRTIWPNVNSTYLTSETTTKPLKKHHATRSLQTQPTYGTESKLYNP